MRNLLFSLGKAQARRQEGVVLVITLLLLMVLSILASLSIKGATSTEQISSQSRQRVLAQQAAEAALRFCEARVQAFRAGRAPSITPQAFSANPAWQVMGNWDIKDPSLSPGLNVIPLAAFGDTPAAAYFNRPPECIAEYAAVADTSRVIVTARGFGPEVPTERTNTAPVGTEVWLQSIITML